MAAMASGTGGSAHMHGSGGATSASADAIVAQFETYEDYLDSQVSARELFYLEDEQLARQLVEVGVNRGGELSRAEFEERKLNAKNAKTKKEAVSLMPKTLAHAGKYDSYQVSPLLSALAEREELVRSGRLSVIVFLRTRNAKGQEVSGYIDFAHRLKAEKFEDYFDRKKKFCPKPTDLSFYNWETQAPSCTPTSNFQVLAKGVDGLRFKNKKDRKVLTVDPSSEPGDNSRRVEIEDPMFAQVVIFDHVTRRKT
jgi:cilia- and flagella-associated protein 299